MGLRTGYGALKGPQYGSNRGPNIELEALLACELHFQDFWHIRTSWFLCKSVIGVILRVPT